MKKPFHAWQVLARERSRSPLGNHGLLRSSTHFWVWVTFRGPLRGAAPPGRQRRVKFVVRETDRLAKSRVGRRGGEGRSGIGRNVASYHIGFFPSSCVFLLRSSGAIWFLLKSFWIIRNLLVRSFGHLRRFWERPWGNPREALRLASPLQQFAKVYDEMFSKVDLAKYYESQ